MADRKNTKTSVIARNAAIAAVVALAGGGRIRIFSGSQPQTAAAVNGSLLWESPVLPTPAFGEPVEGVAQLLAPQPAEILASGTPKWFRVSDDVDEPLWDGSVGDPDDGNEYNMEVTDTDFVQGGVFILNALSYAGEAQGN